MKRRTCLFLALLMLAGIFVFEGLALADSQDEYSISGDLWSYKVLDEEHIRIAYNPREADWVVRMPSVINEIPVTEVGNEFVKCNKGCHLVLPDSLTKIDSFAFSGSGFTVQIPDSVTDIADNAFDLCSSFEIFCNDDSYAEQYAKNKGLSYTTDSKKIKSAYTLRPIDSRDDRYSKAMDYDQSKDYANALSLFLKLAKDGFPRSAFKCGEYYEEGYGVDKDKKQSFKWYLAAADAGHARAQYAAGLCYLKGRGVKGNKKTAVEYFRHALDQGEREGFLWLGYCYHKGLGVDKDLHIAKDLYQRGLTAGAKYCAKRLKEVENELKKLKD